MENDNSNKNHNSDKSQTMFMIGIALIVIGITIFFIGYSQPRIYVNDKSNVQTTIIVNSNLSSSTSYINNEISTNTNKQEITYSYPININTATYEELISIKGIGETKANLIINYRNEVGPFQSLDDLKNIKGFGDETVKKLSQYLTV